METSLLSNLKKCVYGDRITEKEKEDNRTNAQIFKKLPSCIQYLSSHSSPSHVNPIQYDYTLWVYVHRGNWTGTSLPSEAVLFYRKNEKKGLYANSVYWKRELKQIHLSFTYAVLEIPTEELDDPVLIVLLDGTRQVKVIIDVSADVTDSCQFPKENEYTYRSVSSSSLKRFNKPISFKTLLSQMLYSVVQNTTSLNVKAKLDRNEENGVCELKYYRDYDADSLLTAKEAFREAINKVKDFAFFKYYPAKTAGLVVSMNRIERYFEDFNSVDHSAYSTLDDVYNDVQQFVVRYSNNIPGNYSAEERSVLLEQDWSVSRKFALFLTLKTSLESIDHAEGKGVLSFTRQLNYRVYDWKLVGAENQELSERDILALREYVRG